MPGFPHCRAFLIRFGIILIGVSSLWSQPVINEFMASNTATLADDDGAFSDWIEIHNPGTAAVNLNGWYLTDSATNKTKWQFPAVSLPAGGYLVVFASDKNRRDAAAPLHTNFALGASGDYLALISPDGTTIASEFSPKYPAQQEDVSYGMVRLSSGVQIAAYMSRPSPGAANTSTGLVTLAETVSFSRPGAPFQTSFTLTLTGAGSSQQIRYVLVSTVSGTALPEPTAQSTLYTGPITISTSVQVRAAIFTNDGSARGPTRGAQYSRIGADLASFTSQNPVIVIDTLGSGALAKDGLDHPAWMYTFPARSNNAPVFGAAAEAASPLNLSVRGSSSADFPKKGYSANFTNEAGGRHTQALLGLPAYEKWILSAPWKYDLNYINNAVVYALGAQLNQWVPRVRFAEVFVNANGGDVNSSDYVGVYQLTDRLEVAKGRIELANLSPSNLGSSSITGGYLLKIDYKDPDEIGWLTSRGIPDNGKSSVILVSPEADKIAPAQLNYIRDYVQRMENALVADRDVAWTRRTYLDYIDRASWVDHHLLNTFACNPDAFQRSAYFSKDRDGRLVAGPLWDFDRALGSYWDERSFRYDLWYGVGGPDVWNVGWWGIIARDPEFMQDWIDRWQALRGGPMSNGNLRAVVDAQGAMVGAAAAVRDAARWPDNVSPYGTYAQTLDHLKGWLVARAEWIDQQFLAPPALATAGNSLTVTAPAGAQLAYTLDGSDPRSLGGDVAPNALLAAGPLTVPAGSNLHVRSYNPALRSAFPGSPWSSAVGGAASSPLSPRARLVNLSSRALVGSGDGALIAGVVVADTEGKRFLSRGVGPTLTALGVGGAVPDPQLTIYGSNSAELFRNNGWESGPDATRLPGYSKSVGAFALPVGSLDSALASVLTAGSYTLQVTTPSGRSGVGLAELYELDANGRTVNLSTRARVLKGDGGLIGGFVVQGPAYKRMLVRAVGPTLEALGLTGVLRDPVLTIYSGQQVVATNDRWEDAVNSAAMVAAARNAGAFVLAARSEDAALLVTLPPGAYTVEVKGKSDTEGVALLEIYEVP